MRAAVHEGAARLSRRTVAAATVGILGLLIAFAVMPFLLGLIGAPVLAITFAPMHAWARRHAGPRTAASLVVVAALLAIFVPAVAVTALIVSQLPSVLSGPGVERVLASLTALRFGRFAIGAEMATLSGEFAAWVSRQAIGLIGSVTFVAVNLLIAFFGLFYLLLAGQRPWQRVARYLPFSEETTERLRVRFHDVTRATILGIAVTALLQGSIVGLSFFLLRLDHALLWGAVTGIVSVLPVLGSSMVWLPGVVVLMVDHRYGAAATLFAIGFIIASNVDNVVRPVIFRRVSHIHPLVTVVGAFAGMHYFGLLGLLLGPLTLVYFMELLRAWEDEYGAPPAVRPDAGVPGVRRIF
ncbi:MAG TPA: AI-2E family transporter [Gemmatimonadaceae bacterium]|nr:AI-2E family transporter [Gemmatimonadaceae bacterium]